MPSGKLRASSGKVRNRPKIQRSFSSWKWTIGPGCKGICADQKMKILSSWYLVIYEDLKTVPSIFKKKGGWCSELTFWAGRAYAQNLNSHSSRTWSTSPMLHAHCFTCRATCHWSGVYERWNLPSYARPARAIRRLVILTFYFNLPESCQPGSWKTTDRSRS